MKIAPQQKGMQVRMLAGRSPFYSDMSPNNKSQHGFQAEQESASYVFRGSMNDPGPQPVMVTSSHSIKQTIPGSQGQVKEELKLPLQSLMDKSLISQGIERHNQSLPDMVNSCRSLQQKENGFFDITSGRILDHMQTYNQSMQKELQTLEKKETEASPNPELREWNREPAVIFQIETDIRCSKKDHPLHIYAQTGIDPSIQNQRSIKSIDEALYKKFTSKRVFAPQQKIVIDETRSVTKRLKGRNFTFNDGPDGKSRPFTAKLKSDRQANLHAKTATKGNYLAEKSRQQTFSATGQRPVDLRDFVKINKNGQSTIISDQELQKRLLNVDASDPHNNCLLKRNPLIIEKKNFQNAHEFYQQAQQSVMKVAAQTKQSQLLLNSRNLQYASQLRDLRGKDYASANTVLFDFLDRLKKVDPSQEPKKFAASGDRRTPKKDVKRYRMPVRNQSSGVDQGQNMHVPGEKPISEYTRCGSNRSFSDSNHDRLREFVKVDVQRQISKIMTEQIFTEKIHVESNPRTIEPDKANMLPQSNRYSMKNLDLIVETQEPQSAQIKQVELASLKQKHKDEMVQLQQRQQLVRSLGVDQLTPRTPRRGGVVSPLSVGTRELESIRDSQIATLVNTKENQMEQGSILVQFQEIGGTKIKFQTAKARCQSAHNRCQGSDASKQINQVFLTCKTDQLQAIVADSYTIENLENSFDAERNSIATDHINNRKKTPLGRSHKRAAAVTSFGHQKFDHNIISIHENDQGKLQLIGTSFRMPMSGKQVSHRQKGYKYQTKKSRDTITTRVTDDRPLGPKSRVILSQCSQPKILHPFSNRNVRSTRGSNEPIFVIDAKAEKLINQDVNLQLLNSNSFAVKEIAQIQIKDQELYNEFHLQSTERHPNEVFSSRQIPNLRGNQNQTIITSQSMQAIRSSKVIKDHMQNEANKEKTQQAIKNSLPENQQKKSLSLLKSKSQSKTRTPMVDSNRELANQVQIVPRSESQASILKKTQFGYFLTNLKFATSQDDPGIGTLNTAVDHPTASVEAGQMPYQEYQRSKKKGKLLQGLLYHRPISSHHKGLSITKAISLSKPTRKAKSKKKETFQVEVVNSTYKIQRKIQSVLIRAENNQKINADIIKSKHELEFKPRNYKNATFSAQHASITTNQLPAGTLQTVLGQQPISVTGDNNNEIKPLDFIRSDSPILDGYKSAVKLEFELTEQRNIDLCTVEKATSKKELVLCRKLIKGHDFHNPLSSGRITSKTDSVDI